MVAVLVGGEYGLFVVTALGEMQPVGKFSFILQENAFARWFCTETK